MSLPDLLQEIEALGGADASPVVSMEAFFDGNEDQGSIGPNLYPHPGLDTFQRVLQGIEQRPSVARVLVQISEVMSEDEWPFSDRVYVVTTATTGEVHDWAAELEPDPYDETVPDDWLDGRAPPGAPAIPEGHRVVPLFWD